MNAKTASTCPLCLRANDCAMDRGSADCWCANLMIPAAVLERIPEAQKGMTCVCRDCAEGERATSGSS